MSTQTHLNQDTYLHDTQKQGSGAPPVLEVRFHVAVTSGKIGGLPCSLAPVLGNDKWAMPWTTCFTDSLHIAGSDPKKTRKPPDKSDQLGG